MEIRQEDLGKMLLKEATPLDVKVITDVLTEYFNDTKNRLYLLYGRGTNYFTVAQNNSMLAEDSAKKFMDFLNESAYFVIVDGNAVPYGMHEVVEIEYNKTIKAVELWIGEGNPQYFQLMGWDESSIQI